MDVKIEWISLLRVCAEAGAFRFFCQYLLLSFIEFIFKLNLNIGASGCCRIVVLLVALMHSGIVLSVLDLLSTEPII